MPTFRCGVASVEINRGMAMERLTRHHLFYERPNWKEVSEYHKTLVSTTGLIFRLPADIHNQGKQSLHGQCARTVPLISKESAKELVSVTRELSSQSVAWLGNIDLVTETLYELNEVATADHIEQQRGFVLEAILRNHFIGGRHEATE